MSSHLIEAQVVRFRSRPRRPVPARRGFTFVELLIVLLIVAVLAAFAYPAYRDQIRKTRRGDAESVLMQTAQVLERYYTEHGTYTGATRPYTKSPIEGADTYYSISLSIPSSTTYTITATPQGAEAGAGVLTLDQTGRRGRDRNKDNDTADSGEDSW